MIVVSEEGTPTMARTLPARPGGRTWRAARAATRAVAPAAFSVDGTAFAVG
ncbi:hypothetical protein GCM10023170_080500 [Phytohabitans houttuyneae]|uniref:Uncharacterized protein n=1 Tax=Phytohabitans houttuyneae TaxID=1076126 RepID=A0A6V8KNX6_9ACTN|nr:hypothetical protein Phou_084880 [Phytohabitans houttuyneae]